MSGRWDQVKEIFGHAVELDGAEREAYVKHACGGDAELLAAVRRLLAADDGGDALLDGDARTALGRAPAEPAEGASDTIDAYVLLNKIGEGGMGEVWLAEQSAPVRRRVALKIIKLGMDSRRVVARFEAERQALAVMNHAAIAKVFDAGTTPRGRLYFAMEHVAGVPITDYCDRERLRTPQRLDLFLRVCEGVQHAHRKGIIHRDLKPSNILVVTEDGRAAPKIIDFGIAKVTEQRLTDRTELTELGSLMGTPEYMSPEQAGASVQDVDTRSDVYSLGVVLYQLLTGALPFESETLRQAGLDEARRRIREDDPPTPSTRIRMLGVERKTALGLARRCEPALLGRQLRGDLDWIAMRALEKEPARRYGSPDELAADIRRHLAHEPVVAGPPGPAYRTRKFLRRNRLGVGFAALLAVVLLGFAVTMAVQTRRLARSAAELGQVAEFQASQLSSIDPELMGGRLRESLLAGRRRTLQRMERPQRAIDDAVAELDRALAEVNFTDIANISLDQNIFVPTLATIDREFAEQPLVRARLLQSLATIMYGFSFFDRAYDSQAEALRIRQRLLPEAHPDTLESIIGMVRITYGLNRHDEGSALIRQATANAVRRLGHDDPQSLRLQYLGSGGPDQRLAIIDRMQRILGQDHPITMESRIELTMTHLSHGELALAVRQARETLAAAEQALGPDHTTTLEARLVLGGTLLQSGDLGEAERLLSESLPRVRSRHGDDHPQTVATMTTLATVLESVGRLEEADYWLRFALESSRQHARDIDKAVALHNLGFVRFKLGRLEEAAALLTESLDLRLAIGYGEDDQGVAWNLGNLALVRVAMGRGQEAEALARRSLAGAIAASGERHWLVANSRGQLGLALAAQARYAEAEHELLEAHASLLRSLGEDHERTRRVAGYLVDLYSAWHKVEPEADHTASAARWHAAAE